MSIRCWIGLSLLLISVPGMLYAVEKASYEIRIINHHFEPAELKVAAGQRIMLVIHNADDTMEEFESDDLHREKIITPHDTIRVSFGPLEPGEYRFFGEFHPETAQGIIRVVPPGKEAAVQKPVDDQ